MPVPEVDGVEEVVIDELAIDVPVDSNEIVKNFDGIDDYDTSDVNLALRVLRRPVNDAIDDGDKTLVTDNDGKLLADMLRVADEDLVTDALEETLPDTVSCAVTVNFPLIDEVDVIKKERDEIVVPEAVLEMVDDIELTGVFV